MASVQGNYYSVAARGESSTHWSHCLTSHQARAQALFIWDYLATFDSEVQYVWGQRLSAATILFIVNRYVNLLITILELIEQAPFQTPEVRAPSCRTRAMFIVTLPLEVSAITTCVPMSTCVQTVDGSSCPPVVRVLQSLLISATFIVAGECTSCRGLNSTFIWTELCSF